jgi:tetratricopeptide (TPR) repeat protein
LLLPLLLAFAGGCSRRGSLQLARIAVLPFDNLTGDPELQRMAPLSQAVIATMIGSRIAGPSENVAILNGAASVARGVLEHSAQGKIRVTVDIFQTSNHKLIRSVSGEGSTAFDAASQAAGQLAPGSKFPAYRSPQTIELWTSVLGGGLPAKLKDNCKALLDADPAFSPGYPACHEIMTAAMPREEAQAIAERAYQQRGQLSVDAIHAVGQVLFLAGSFAHANELLRQSAAVYPAAWNQVGYAEAMLGHAAESRKALEDYRKMGGDESNAVDSLGETQFILSNYQEAEKYFLECDSKFPQTPQGRTGKIKAAAMRALRGDRTGAEELARGFIDPLKKAGQDVRQIEESWRAVILEQDPKEMRRKVENSIIGVPGRGGANTAPAAEPAS